MAGGSLGTLAVYLTANMLDFHKGIDGALAKLSSFATVTPLKLAVGATALTAFAIHSLKSFAESEKAIAHFNETLRANGDYVLGNSQKLIAFAEQTAKVTLYTKAQVLETMALGRNMGIVPQNLDRVTRAAMGLASAYHLDLEASMKLVAKAAEGHTQNLARFGIVLKETLTPQEKFNELLRRGEQGFELTKGEADTLAGSYEKLKQSLDDVWKAFGSFFNELMGGNEGVKELTDNIRSFSDYVKSSAFESAYVIKEAFIGMEYGFKLFFETGQVGFERIFVSIDNMSRRFFDISSWIGANWTSVWKGMGDISIETFIKIAEFIDEATSIFFGSVKHEIANIMEAVKTGSVDAILKAVNPYAAVMDQIEIVTDKARESIAAISKDLKLAPIEFHDATAETFGNMVERIDAEHEKALSGLGERELKRKQEEIDKQYGAAFKKNPLETIGTAGKMAVEHSFSAALQYGTAQAYSLALGGRGGENEVAKKTEQHTKKISDNSDKQVQFMQRMSALAVAQ
jgi:hypothetical protein